jgi:hypothetical protein
LTTIHKKVEVKVLLLKLVALVEVMVDLVVVATVKTTLVKHTAIHTTLVNMVPTVVQVKAMAVWFMVIILQSPLSEGRM